MNSSTERSIALKSARPGTTQITRLPFEVLVGQIFSILELSDLARLARVSRFFQQLCQADYLWQRKFLNDFWFRPTTTLRQLGWKRLYQAMDRVEVYTWGSNSDFRLGYGRSPKKFYESVPKRIRRLDGVGIVQLAPTGWGCHALDRHGNVWAWGRIMESNGIRSDAIPKMLKRPKDITEITAGRQVVLAKDKDGRVWQWCRENKAVEVSFAMEPRDEIVHLSAGWELCAALTRSGRIFAWRPPQTADGRYQHRIHLEHSVSLKEQGHQGYEAVVMDGDRFEQIACGTDYVVAVSSKERVYIFRRLDSPYYHEALPTQSPPRPRPQRSLEDETDLMDRIVIETVVEGSLQERVVEMRGKLIQEGLYLPIFSEALAYTVTEPGQELPSVEQRRRNHRLRHSHRHSYTDMLTTRMNGMPSTCSLPTTVSANFQNFALHHASGKVLLGREDVQAKSCPMVMERLLSNAYQVGFGDHHQALLTEDGQLRTWGAFAEGALGHGDLRSDCSIPTVVEGPLKNKFVIAIGLAGWQSACLAIDLNEDRTPFDQSIVGQESEARLSISSSSGSGSETFDSSDGEEWTVLETNHILGDQLSSPYPASSSSSTSLSSSPSSLASAMSMPFTPSAPSVTLYSSCTPSCSLLVSPHSHRHHGGSHPRNMPLRKRSLSMVDKYNDPRHPLDEPLMAQKYRAPVLALTRLNPVLRMYSSEVESMTEQISRL